MQACAPGSLLRGTAQARQQRDAHAQPVSVRRGGGSAASSFLELTAAVTQCCFDLFFFFSAVQCCGTGRA